MSTEGNFIYTGKKREKKIYNSGASPAMHVLGKRGERRGKEGKGREKEGKIMVFIYLYGNYEAIV